jgi:predicted AlkP superfamily phosphohydrolase/phosphomutase
MPTRREFIKTSAILSLGLPLIGAGCQKPGPRAKNMDKKVIVLGIDGFDPKMVRTLMSQGELPHFAALAQSGFFSSLATSNPPQSPVAWSCIATGNNPGKHGVYDFLIRNPKSYLPDLSIIRMKKGGLQLSGPSFAPSRQSEAFWETLSKAGIDSTVLRWPMTFPPEDVSGRILSGLGVPDIKGGLGRYTYFTSKVPKNNEEGADKVVLVKVFENRVKTEMEGPLVSGLTGNKTVKIPLTVLLDRERGLATLHLDGKDYEVKEKAWSPWIRVRFDAGFFNKVYGICRFYLAELKPFFSLYLTAVQVDPEAPCFPISQPANYAAELAAKVGTYYTLGIPEDTKAVTEHRLSEDGFLGMCDQIVSEQEAMFRYELERFKQGLLATVFFTTDRIQHIFWATQDPSHPAFNEQSVRDYGQVMNDYYRRLDRILGETMAKVDDKTLLVVCSDHGFTSFRKAVHLNTWLAGNGFMALKKEPNAQDTQGGPLFQNVDWKSTKAYAMGLGSIYINLKDREGEGTVSREDYPKVVNDLRDRLLGFRDPATGEQVVKAAYPRAEIYKGRFVEDAPDLVVGFSDGYRMSWQSAIGGAPAQLIEENNQKWTGDHCMDPSLVPGVLFMNRKLNSESASLLDIAPTVLQYFGLSSDMDGHSLI